MYTEYQLNKSTTTLGVTLHIILTFFVEWNIKHISVYRPIFKFIYVIQVLRLYKVKQLSKMNCHVIMIIIDINWNTALLKAVFFKWHQAFTMYTVANSHHIIIEQFVKKYQRHKMLKYG